jgi:branched-chain amino acid aminotransferase
MHRFLLHNDDVLAADARVLAPGQVGLFTGWGVFTTIRVYDGVIFAWDRHWARMKADAHKIRVPFPENKDHFEERLHKLIEANQAFNSTLRIYVVRNRGGIWEGPGQTRDFDIVAFTRDVAHWPEWMQLSLVENARMAASEFAGVKYLSWAENLARYERAHEQGYDDALLLNERGEVAECTSANVFIAERSGENSHQIWTPPLKSGGLAGVSRALVLEEVKAAGIVVGEKIITPKDLEAADEVFITSSTRELLPVSKIEGLKIKGGRAVCDRLQDSFAAWIKTYVGTRSKVVQGRLST